MEHFAERLIAGMSEAIIYADADGVIRYWNHGAAQVFGSNASETLGQPPDIIIPAGTSGATPASGSCVATFW
jgi:PAS domain S-box-containing protein